MAGRGKMSSRLWISKQRCTFDFISGFGGTPRICDAGSIDHGGPAMSQPPPARLSRTHTNFGMIVNIAIEISWNMVRNFK